MQSFFRSSRLATRSSPILSRSLRPYATQSYGGAEESGHPKSDAPNPRSDLEHPGPEAPASKGTDTESSSSSSSKPSSEAAATPQNPDKSPSSSDADVKAHNEKMDNKFDKATTSLKE